jgi:hypothetical protein
MSLNIHEFINFHNGDKHFLIQTVIIMKRNFVLLNLNFEYIVI